MEFRSLGSLLRGESNQGRARIYGAYFGFQRAVIDGNWKLIHYPVAKVFRLFDLTSDPDELHDLADDPAQAGRLAEMKWILGEEMKSQADPLVREQSLVPASAQGT
jgi:arylsulfatase A-like enzyme